MNPSAPNAPLLALAGASLLGVLALWFAVVLGRASRGARAAGWALLAWALALPFWAAGAAGALSTPSARTLLVTILALAAAAAAFAGLALKSGGARGLSFLALALAAGVVPLALAGNARQARGGARAGSDEAVSREVLRFRSFNFRFAPPPDPWVRLDAARLGGNAVAEFMRTEPKIFFSIAAESGDDAQAATTEAVAETLLGELRSGARSFELLEQRPWGVNGLAGLLLVAESDRPSARQRFVCWVYALNGFAFELRARADAREGTAAAIEAEVVSLLPGFEILDRERVASGKALAAEPFRSTAYGYEVVPENGRWSAWTRAGEDVPGAEYGLFTDEDESLAVIPISLLGQDPDQETLAQGLLERLDISYPNEAVSSCRPVGLGGLTGCDYDFERTEEGGDYAYRLRVVKGRGFGYLVASWLPRRLGAEGRRRLDAAQALVRFTRERPAPLPASMLRPASRGPYSMVFNEMGLASYGKERYAESLSYFRLAFELDEVDPTLLENVVEAFMALGRYREALDYLNTHARGFPHASQLEEWRDFLKDQIEAEREESLGKKAAALLSALPRRA